MIRRYASLSFVDRLHAELERLVQEIEVAGESVGGLGWQPKLDVVETEDSLLFQLETPGLRPGDLHVSVEGDVVTVSGEKKAAPPGGAGARFQCMEREQGRFVRRVKLLVPVNSHAGRAHLADGVLAIEFPKIQEQRQAAYEIEIVEDTEGDSHD